MEVDGTEYPLGYLFLDNDGNGVSGARTNVIVKFLAEFRTHGIFPQFFLTDKDFTQISAGQTVWPNTKNSIMSLAFTTSSRNKIKGNTHFKMR